MINSNPLYTFNNGYDDEEALRAAISHSLEDEMVPPSQRYTDDISNAEMIQNNPVSNKIYQVLRMVKKSRSKINELINLNSSSKSQDKNVQKEEALSESQQIRRQQDIEYKEALELAQKKEKEKELLQIQENNDNYEETILQKLKEIGEEPKNGIILAVNLNKKTIKRSFSPNALGRHVYIWAAADESMISKKICLGQFKLRGPVGEYLDEEKSLTDQKIKPKTIYSVYEDE